MKILDVVIENCSGCPFYKFETLYDGVCGRLYNRGIIEKVHSDGISWMCPLNDYKEEDET